ncbi:MAG: DUF2807 domain-containing protein [Pseudomonadota bacterium]
MIRALIIIAVASFVLALGCFAGAAAFGGRELAANGWVWPGKWNEYGIHISDDGDVSASPSATRDLTWTGGDTLDVDLAADVLFAQGETAKVTVEGPQRLLDRVAIENGRLFVRDDGGDYIGGRDDKLRVTITAPDVRKFIVNGSGDLRIEGYDQENLTIEVNGSGDVKVAGRAVRLATTISGSGEADLEALDIRDANVKVVGSGEVELRPTGAVQVAISGSGDVRLLSKPVSLVSEIDGSGEVHNAY